MIVKAIKNLLIFLIKSQTTIIKPIDDTIKSN